MTNMWEIQIGAFDIIIVELEHLELQRKEYDKFIPSDQCSVIINNQLGS